METFYKITLIFTVIGAINWGLVGFFDFNLVESLFSQSSTIPSIIYGIVGICGLINIGIFYHKKEKTPNLVFQLILIFIFRLFII